MKNQFVTFEIAKQLKDLEFEEPCLMVFRGGDLYASGSISRYEEDWKPELNSNCGEGNQWVSAPLWQQVIDWLYKKYEICITSYTVYKEGSDWEVSRYFIYYQVRWRDQYSGFTKEEVVLKALEMIKERNKSK